MRDMKQEREETEHQLKQREFKARRDCRQGFHLLVIAIIFIALSLSAIRWPRWLDPLGAYGYGLLPLAGLLLSLAAIGKAWRGYMALQRKKEFLQESIFAHAVLITFPFLLAIFLILFVLFFAPID